MKRDLNLLSDEQIVALAAQYHESIALVTEIVRQNYSRIHFKACAKKGVFTSPCCYVLLTDEKNDLNGEHEEAANGYL